MESASLLLKSIKKLIDQPGPVYGPGMRKWQLFNFCLGVAVVLPALFCLRLS